MEEEVRNNLITLSKFGLGISAIYLFVIGALIMYHYFIPDFAVSSRGMILGAVILIEMVVLLPTAFFVLLLLWVSNRLELSKKKEVKQDGE